MSFDWWKIVFAFSYTWSARIRLRECAEINLLSFSRLLDILRRSEEYQRCRPTLAVPLAVCQLANLLQHSNDLQAATKTPLQAMLKIFKRPQGLLRRQFWGSPSGHKTPEQAIILKIDSSLNNQESYRQSGSKALVEEAEVTTEITPEIKQNQAIQFSFSGDTTQFCSKYM